MAKVIEHARAGYEVEEVEHGKVYRWRPGSVVVECACGERASLTPSEPACEECGAEHTRLVRESSSGSRPQGDENARPWRYAEESDGALPY